MEVKVENDKGKGKVRPRKSQLAQANFVPRIDAISHHDVQHGGRFGDPTPRYPEHLTNGNDNQIPKFRTTDPVQYNKALDRIRKGLPVVLKECPLLGDRSKGTSRPGLFPACSFDSLAEAFAGSTAEWHAKEPETEELSTTFADFVQCCRSWTSRKIHLQ
eukprot:gene27265-33576_t